MKKGIILYQSKYGATKKYAEWLQESTQYEPWQKALMCAVGQKCDWTERKYLEPILEAIKCL